MAYDAQPDAEVTARDRMIRLADHLRALPAERFSMSNWYGHGWWCGTVGCIGGHAQMMFEGKDTQAWKRTGALLGLTRDQSADLFFMKSTSLKYGDLTKDMAVRVLDNYLITGEIDWSVAERPSREP